MFGQALVRDRPLPTSESTKLPDSDAQLFNNRNFISYTYICVLPFVNVVGDCNDYLLSI